LKLNLISEVSKLWTAEELFNLWKWSETY